MIEKLSKAAIKAAAKQNTFVATPGADIDALNKMMIAKLEVCPVLIKELRKHYKNKSQLQQDFIDSQIADVEDTIKYTKRLLEMYGKMAADFQRIRRSLS